jgi:hypothetical protein
MQTVSSLSELWPSDADLARDIGVPYSTVSAWKQRQSIPAAYWQDLVRAAKARGIKGVTADVLTQLHARPPAASIPSGFDEQDAAPFESGATGEARAEKASGSSSGHFSRFKHLRRGNFASSAEIVEHVRALREEWDRR